MNYRTLTEELAGEFLDRPVEFVAEFDVQARHYERLREELNNRGELHAEMRRPTLAETTSGYKRAYWEAIENKLRSTGRFSRVHTEVSVEQGRRIDLVVFADQLEHPIRWLNGSKRFDEHDLDAAFELKFVKNKSYFPTSTPVASIGDCTDEEIRAALDTEANSLGPDLDELSRLPDHVETFLIVYSNKNYLYADPLSSAERGHRPEYARLGELARESIADRAGDTSVLYAMPCGCRWLTE